MNIWDVKLIFIKYLYIKNKSDKNWIDVSKRI